MFHAGVSLRDGSGIGADLQQAVAWFEKAAARGHTAACDSLHDAGLRFRDGRGVEADWNAAATCFLKAAGGDSRRAADSIVDIAQRLQASGELVAAFRWFSVAAEHQHTGAGYQLGLCLLNGRGTVPDPSRAYRIFCEGASRAHLGCLFHQACCLRDGVGVSQNDAKAHELLERGVALDDVDCVFASAMSYRRRATVLSGSEWLRRLQTEQQPANARKALQRLERVVQLKSDHRDALCQLGFFHLEGLGGAAPDPRAAFDFFLRASNLGCPRAKQQVAAFRLQDQERTYTQLQQRATALLASI